MSVELLIGLLSVLCVLLPSWTGIVYQWAWRKGYWVSREDVLLDMITAESVGTAIEYTYKGVQYKVVPQRVERGKP